MAGGIYTITHTPTGRRYVGQTGNFSLRWQQHLNDLQKQQHHNRYLQSIYNAEGASNLKFIAIQFLPHGLTPLQRQRWLHYAERKHWRELSDAGICLNIEPPVIVETEKAVAEYQEEKKVVTAEITEQIKGLRPAIAKAKASKSIADKALSSAYSVLASAEKALKQNTGWRHFLFGTKNSSREDLASAVDSAKEIVRQLEAQHDEAEITLALLETKRKSLYRKYPGNSKRAEWKANFYSGGVRRRTRIG